MSKTLAYKNADLVLWTLKNLHILKQFFKEAGKACNLIWHIQKMYFKTHFTHNKDTKRKFSITVIFTFVTIATVVTVRTA
jgi:hypothetical protein